MIDKYQKGTTKEGYPMYAYILENEWLQVEVMDLGATITKFIVKEEAYRHRIGGREEIFIVGGKEVVKASEVMGRDILLDGDIWDRYIESNDLQTGSTDMKNQLFSSVMIGEKVCFVASLKMCEEGRTSAFHISICYQLVGKKLHITYHYPDAV